MMSHSSSMASVATLLVALFIALANGCAPNNPATTLPHYHGRTRAQVVLSLRSILTHQGQVWGHERPFIIRDVSRVRLPCHPLLIGPVGQSP